MRLMKFASVMGLLSAIAAVPACGSATNEPVQSAQGALTRAPLSVAATVNGPTKLAADAFAEVPLRADQRSELEQLIRDFDGRHVAIQKARGEASLAIAGQIESGAIDRTALAPKFTAIEAERAKSQAADRAAMERAHALLNPDQRVAFINALQAKFADKIGEKPDHPEHHEGPSGEHGFGLGGWAQDLQLTDDQKAKIRENMKASFAAHQHEHEGHDGHMQHGVEMKARWEQFTTAFKSDHFAMDEIAPKEEAPRVEHEIHDRILTLAEAALPVLTADQRTLAAKKIRERSSTGAPIVDGANER